jgi:hypothetical protein
MKKDPRFPQVRNRAAVLGLALLGGVMWSCGGGGGGSFSVPTAPLPPDSSTEWALSVTLSVRNTVSSSATLREVSVWLDGRKIGSAVCAAAEPCNAVGVNASTVAASGAHRIELRVDRQDDSPNDYGAGGGANVWVASDTEGMRGTRHGNFALKRNSALQTGEGFSWPFHFS